MLSDASRKPFSIIAAIMLALLLTANVVMISRQPVSDPDSSAPSETPDTALSDLSAITDTLPASYREQILQTAQQPVDGQFTADELAAITNFYSESAFVGDSLLIGFRTYLQRNDMDACFVKSTMLASYSYSTRAAIRSITSESIHPIYKGMERQVWESIQLAGAKRVFLMFWANEIPRGDIEAARKNLEKLVAKINDANPGIEIYVVSPCHRYMKPDDDPKYLTNANFTLLANTQKEFCQQNGAGYIEVSKYIGNEAEGIFEEYTFDKYVHINDDAYTIWKQVFCEFALGREAVIDNGH